MRTTLLLPLALTALLGACSGDSAPTSFSDPIAAMDAADSAKAAGDNAAALAGYEYALQNGEASLQADAMIGVFMVHIADGDEAAATASFGRLSSEFAASLNESTILDLLDAAVRGAKMVDLGDTILGYSIKALPEMKDKLAQVSDDIETIRTNGPGVDLSEVGYAGD
jgi:hypothetical protein